MVTLMTACRIADAWYFDISFISELCRNGQQTRLESSRSDKDRWLRRCVKIVIHHHHPYLSYIHHLSCWYHSGGRHHHSRHNQPPSPPWSAPSPSWSPSSSCRYPPSSPWFHNPQIWMPDLQIDQAVEIRNPRYLNDASSFRLFNDDQNSHQNFKLENLLGSTKMGRLYGRPCSTTTSTAPWTSSSTHLTNRCHSVVVVIFKVKQNRQDISDNRPLAKVDLKGLPSRFWELRLHLFWDLAQLDAWGRAEGGDLFDQNVHSLQHINILPVDTVGMFVNLVQSRTRGTLPTSTQPGSITRWKSIFDNNGSFSLIVDQHHF